MPAETVDYRISKIVVLCKDCGQDVGLYPARHKCAEVVRPPLPPLPVPSSIDNENLKPSGVGASSGKDDNWKEDNDRNDRLRPVSPNTPVPIRRGSDTETKMEKKPAPAAASGWLRLRKAMQDNELTSGADEKKKEGLDDDDDDDDTQIYFNNIGKDEESTERAGTLSRWKTRKGDAQTTGARLWDKLLAATQQVADRIPVKQEQVPESDDDDVDAETYITKAIREHWQEKGKRLPSWLGEPESVRSRSGILSDFSHTSSVSSSTGPRTESGESGSFDTGETMRRPRQRLWNNDDDLAEETSYKSKNAGADVEYDYISRSRDRERHRGDDRRGYDDDMDARRRPSQQPIPSSRSREARPRERPRERDMESDAYRSRRPDQSPDADRQPSHVSDHSRYNGERRPSERVRPREADSPYGSDPPRTRTSELMKRDPRRPSLETQNSLRLAREHEQKLRARQSERARQRMDRPDRPDRPEDGYERSPAKYLDERGRYPDMYPPRERRPSNTSVMSNGSDSRSKNSRSPQPYASESGLYVRQEPSSMGPEHAKPRPVQSKSLNTRKPSSENLRYPADIPPYPPQSSARPSVPREYGSDRDIPHDYRSERKYGRDF
ncbi:hypothetical protein BZG36_04031 [Bifiguratus adelaidae]|uniref:Mso1 N-terminal domain-containing protein n=1 Tax=Bifiguratus adelaidae TaxID=1938954 RepID=A0A261XYS5_9FUNG|nr:hypothetical protein BZG36_04031 [Bifiguratus adelaidae]